MTVHTSINDMVLRPDTSTYLIVTISFHACYKGSVKLGENGRLQESCLKFVKSLLLYMSISKGNMFSQIN